MSEARWERLGALLRDLRALLRSEVPLRLHAHANGQRSSRAPEGDETAPRRRAMYMSYGTRVGLPFTASFERYIGHPDGWGKTRTGMSSILEISEWCHGRHTSHEIPDGPRSLCAQLVYEASYWGKGLSEISATYSLPSTQLEGMLVSALEHAVEFRQRSGKRWPTYAEVNDKKPLLRTA